MMVAKTPEATVRSVSLAVEIIGDLILEIPATEGAEGVCSGTITDAPFELRSATGELIIELLEAAVG